MKRQVVLVTGSRHWTDEEAIERRLDRYPAGTILIHGACEGADMIADRIGRANAFQVVGIRYFQGIGPKGGPCRNTIAVNVASAFWSSFYGKEFYDVTCEAFPLDGPGTADCMAKADAAGIPVFKKEHP